MDSLEEQIGSKRLGDILKAGGHITDAQLQEALAVQAKSVPKRMLGQILISRGYLTSAHIQIALAKQKTTQPA